MSYRQITIDIDDTSAVTDKAVGSGQDIIDTDAKTDSLYHLVLSFRYSEQKATEYYSFKYLIGVFRMDIVLDRLGAGLFKVFRGDLD